MLTPSWSLLVALVAVWLSYNRLAVASFNHAQPSEVLRTADSRIRGARSRTDKDFVFGGLIPIHSDDPGSGGGQCGAVRTERGLERMEAMLFALDLINNDSDLLPGLQIGYDIRDTCNSENIGLDETIDLIITGSQLDLQSCPSATTMGPNSTVDSVSVNPPTSGIIGAAASRVSVPVASLVRLFQTPQISYASSSAILSNRDRYGFFYRTIPPDDQQARAMLDILLHFNWTYVSTIYSQNPYGEPGISEFRELAAQNGICIDLDIGIEDSFSESDFDMLASSLIASSANVVIVFASQDNAEQLLRRISNSNSPTRFTWIASDAWARSINVVSQYSETAAGLYGIAPLTEHVDQFNDYYSKLTIDNNIRNPWFAEYFSAFAECSLLNDSSNPCPTNLSVVNLPQYEQGNVVPLVIDAVFAYAHALHNFLSDSCQQPVQWNRGNRSCAGQTQQLTGSVLLTYISQLDFVNNATGHRIIFDSRGNVEGQYEILNYQATGDRVNRKYSFVRAGIWDSSVLNDSNQEALTLDNTQNLQFGIDGSNSLRAIRFRPQISQCGRCEIGQYRRVVQSACCGICEPCIGQNYSSGPMSLRCLECQSESWGNNPLDGSDGCVSIPESFIRYSDPFSIVVILLAVLGVVAVLFVTIVFVVHWRRPVVKSSGREQMITLLIGIGLVFLLAFVYVSPPQPGVCAVQRMGFWICYSIIFGALFVKIVRVTRIFYRGSNPKRIRFTEPYYQVLFTSIIIAGQVLIVVLGLIVVHPDISRVLRLNRDNQNDLPETVISCVVDHTAILVLCVAYETILIIVSTILGVLSFKYPENFNEAKFVSFCTFIIAIIWAAFVGLYAYFALEGRQEVQNAITGLASVLSGYAVLGCLFGPKLFVIFFRPRMTKESAASHELDTDINLTTLSRNHSAAVFRTDTLSTMMDDHSLGVTMPTKSEYIPPPVSPSHLVTMDTLDSASFQPINGHD